MKTAIDCFHLNQEALEVSVEVIAHTAREPERYLLTNIEMWITGEDRILVKQAITDEDKEYVLTKLELAEPR